MKLILPSANEKPKILKETVVHNGKWYTYTNIDFQATSHPKVWEKISRAHDLASTREIAIAYSKGKKYYLVNAQYRAAVESLILEFPSGMSNKGESIESAGIREIKEETGYVAVPSETIKIKLHSDPWKSDECGILQFSKIDLNDKVNMHPIQSLDDEEFIKSYLLDADNFLDEIMKLVKEKGYKVDSGLHAFATSLELRKYINMKK